MEYNIIKKQRDKWKICLILFLVLAAIVGGLYLYNVQLVRRAEREFPPVGQFVTVEDIRLHYVCKGSGKSIVLLHGNAGFLQDYSMTVLDRAMQEYHTCAFDRPGHGYSDRPSNEVATAEVQTRLLHIALRELGIKKPVLIGHSWSGALALLYALQYPDEISGIVLFGTVAYESDAISSPLGIIPQIPVLGDVLTSLLSVPFGGWFIKQRLILAYSPDSVPMNFLKVAQALWTRPHQVKAIAQDSTTIGTTLKALGTRYGNIRLPVVIVTGDSDELVKPEQHSYPLHKAIAHSKLIVLLNTGHEIPHTRPEAFMDAIHMVWEQVPTPK